MLGVLRFWLERGVDGFRVDVLWHLVKDEHFGDNPPNADWREGMDPYNALVPLQTTDRPEVHDIVRRMRRLLDEYRERVLIGEIYLPLERLMQYYGADLQGAHLPFNFQLSERALGRRSPRRPDRRVRAPAARRARGPTGCSATTTGRASPRASGPRRRASRRCCSSRCAARRRFTTATSSACANVSIPPGEVQDPFERRVPGLGLGRDPVRTPMQWSAAPQAGFTAAGRGCLSHPTMKWSTLPRSARTRSSMLALYTRLIALRRAEPALQVGSLGIFRTTNDVSADVLTYFRGDSFLVALNLGGRPRRVQLARGGAIVLSSHLDRAEERVGETLELRPDEGLILRLTN